MTNKITDNAAMVAAIKQAGYTVTRSNGETCARVDYPTRNAEGENLTVHLSYCTDPGTKKSLPALWYKNGDTPTRLDTYWFIYPVAFDSAKDERQRYNPQTIMYGPLTGRRGLDFAWVLEATPENLYRLLAETKRRFLACEK